MQTQAEYNVAVLGKTGVGKSSLINYLFGREVRETGVGRPVTALGFHKQSIFLDGKPVAIFDSGGLETSNFNTWRHVLEKELSSRGPGEPAERWFHAMLYCISVGSSRVDDFEIDVLKRLLHSHNRVIVTFTKCDQAPEDHITAMVKHLEKCLGRSIPHAHVCSVGGQVRGRSLEPFGIEGLRKEIAKSNWDTIEMRLPFRCVSVLHDRIDAWERDQREWIGRNARWFGLDREYEHLRSELEYLKMKLAHTGIGEVVKSETLRTFEIYAAFSSYLKLDALLDIGKQIGWSNPANFSGYSDVFDFVMSAFCWFMPKLSKSNRTILTDSLRQESLRLKDDISELRPTIAKELSDLLKAARHELDRSERNYKLG